MADLTNCLNCGRDTRRLSGICWKCEGLGGIQFDDRKGRSVFQIDGDSPNRTLNKDAEDDYSEESTPDSIYSEAKDLRTGFQERNRP